MNIDVRISVVQKVLEDLQTVLSNYSEEDRIKVVNQIVEVLTKRTDFDIDKLRD